VLLADPEIELTGIPAKTADGEDMTDLAYNAVIEAFESMPKPKRRDPDTVTEAVRRAVRSAVSGHWAKKPMCHVHVLTV
jgi:ribonuclease J